MSFIKNNNKNEGVLPELIGKLSKLLCRVPSIGPKSAEKLAIWFASEGSVYAQELSHVLSELQSSVGICSSCGYFSNAESKLCAFCSDSSREQGLLCIVENILDILEVENSGAYKGYYFILGGVISPLEGKTISDLPFEKLKENVNQNEIKEIIIALGATTEADVTTMFIKELFDQNQIKISLLARGISVGARLTYTGKKSLVEAFRSREELDKKG